MQGFDVLSKLGEGAYSTVFKVRRKADERIYALKQVKLVSLSEKEKSNALNEIRLLASVRHSNIVTYKEAFFDNQSGVLCLVMEYADGGDLYQRVLEYQKKGRYMSESYIWHLALQLAQGLKALHDLHILHRDLKSANVFLYRDGSVKLGDFNVAKVAKDGMLFTQTGTPYYASPEVWRDEPYDGKSDIWSLGCVLYESCALKPPFRAEDMQGLCQKILKGEFQRLPRNFSNDLNAFISRMITVDPHIRPSCEDVLSFPSMSRRFPPVTQSLSDAPSPLLSTIIFPRSTQLLASRLPAANYLDEVKVNQTEPDELLEGDMSLPQISLAEQPRGRQGLTPDARMFQSKALVEKPRDSSDPAKSAGRYYKRVLRESYGGLQVIKRNFRVHSISRPGPIRPLDSSLPLEASPKPALKGRKLRYMNPYTKGPAVEAQNHRGLKRLSEDDRIARKVVASLSPLR